MPIVAAAPPRMAAASSGHSGKPCLAPSGRAAPPPWPGRWTRLPLAGDYGQPARPDWRERDWTPHERDALVDMRRLHYLDMGSGETCFLLIHGLGGCWQNWIASIPPLAQGARVVALDLPGFGSSELAIRNLSVELFADTVAKLVRGLGLGRVVLVGHSMGGPVALSLAAREPEIVRGVVDLGGAAYQAVDVFAGRRLVHHAVRRPRETRAILVERLTSRLPVLPSLKRAVMGSARLRRLFLAPYVRDPAALPADLLSLLIDGAGGPGQAQAARMIAGIDPAAGSDRLHCPLLLAAGEHDLICPLSDVDFLQRSAPAAQVVVFDGCGHLVMAERPQAFADCLLEFAARLP